MGAPKSRTWIVGTAFVALLIFVGAWFLLSSPRRAQTDEAYAANEAAVFEQDQLRARLAVLKEQATHIDEYQAEVDAISVQIPPEAMMPDYLRSLVGLAAQYSVTLLELSPGYPVAYGDAVSGPVVLTPTPAEGEATDGTNPVDTAEETADQAESASAESSGEATAEPTPAPEPEVAANTGLLAIPVVIKVIGTYSNVNALLEGIQEQIGRVFLVTSIDAVSQGAKEASSGRPATSPGDVEMAIGGYLYMYADSSAVATDEEGTTEDPAEPTPLPATERNPFAPIAGV